MSHTRLSRRDEAEKAGASDLRDAYARTAASIADHDGFMAEAAFIDDEGVLFWTYQNGLYEMCSMIERNDTSFIPPADPGKLAEKGVVLLPSAPDDSYTHPELVASLKRFVLTYADVPDFWANLIAHYVLMTWVYDRFTAVPYLRFQGEPQTGKTRLLQIAGVIFACIDPVAPVGFTTAVDRVLVDGAFHSALISCFS